METLTETIYCRRLHLVTSSSELTGKFLTNAELTGFLWLERSRFQEAWGEEVPSGVQGKSPGGVWGQSPQKQHLSFRFMKRRKAYCKLDAGM